ncbi:MAG: PHP domain-containing protein [Bacteroidales bacterium]
MSCAARPLVNGRCRGCSTEHMKDFVHLHVHSQYSFLDGADTCIALVARAASLGMPAIAITDHNNVSAVVELTKAAASAESSRYAAQS